MRIPKAPIAGRTFTTKIANLTRVILAYPTSRIPPRRHPATSARLLVIESLKIPPFKYFNSNSIRK